MLGDLPAQADLVAAGAAGRRAVSGVPCVNVLALLAASQYAWFASSIDLGAGLLVA